MKARRALIFFTLLYSLGILVARGKEAPSPAADRAAVERVYHKHRLGQKQPFEQVLPAAAIEKMARQDSKKEAVLKRVYKVEITRAQVDEEVKRIDSTTRAPEVLDEIKRALGRDPARFARSVARPIVVDRELRARFENDKEAQAPQRRAAEEMRAKLLKKQDAPGLREITWLLSPRPESETTPEPPVPMPNTEGKAASRSYSIEASAQIAQPLLPPRPDSADPREAKKSYFEDLEPELQKALRVQLTKPDDVSAVIETSSSFSVFSAREVDERLLRVATFTVRKRGFEEWLESVSE
jgi:hypothetical protein